MAIMFHGCRRPNLSSIPRGSTVTEDHLLAVHFANTCGASGKALVYWIDVISGQVRFIEGMGFHDEEIGYLMEETPVLSWHSVGGK